MYQKTILSLVAAFLVGCGVQTDVATKSTMFQSVTQKEAVLLQEGKDKESCPRCAPCTVCKSISMMEFR
jgi:hypothetical protein